MGAGSLVSKFDNSLNKGRAADEQGVTSGVLPVTRALKDGEGGRRSGDQWSAMVIGER